MADDNNFNSGSRNSPFGGNPFTPKTGEAGDLFNKAYGDIESGTDTNQSLKNTLDTYRGAINQLKTQRQFIGQRAMGNVGDIRNKIFNNQAEQRQAEADQGVSSGGAGIIRQKQLDSEVDKTDTQFRSNLTSQLLGVNTKQSNEESLLQEAVSGSQSIRGEFAKFIAHNRIDLGRATHDDSFIVHFFKGLGGYRSAGSQGIDWDKASKDKQFVDLAKQIGLDIKNKDVQGSIDTEVRKGTQTGGKETGHGFGWLGMGALGGIFSKGYSDYNVKPNGKWPTDPTYSNDEEKF